MANIKTWKQEEIDYLTENVERLTDFQMCEALLRLFNKDVSIWALRKKRQRLNLYKVNGRGISQLVKNFKGGQRIPPTRFL